MGPAARLTGAETAAGLTAMGVARVAMAAKWAPLQVAIRPSDSLEWPDGPRGTLAARGFPFYYFKLLLTIRTPFSRPNRALMLIWTYFFFYLPHSVLFLFDIQLKSQILESEGDETSRAS